MLSNDTVQTDGSILTIDESLHKFLKDGHTFDPFHRLGYDFSIKQRLNNFVKIGDRSGFIFLRTTPGILSGPV